MTPQFTPREMDVLRLLGEGLTNEAIGKRLGLSEGTVKVYVSGVFKKLDVHSRVQAALWYAKQEAAKV